MRGVVLSEPNVVELEDVNDPKVPAGEVLIKVTNSGICGTDWKIFSGGIPVKYPLIMGHESVGEVVEGTGFKPGDKVIVDPAYYCGKCYQCRDDQQHICPNGGLIGRDRDGGFAEYMTAPEHNVHILPDEIDLADAPLIQPMTTVLHAQRLADIKPGEAVVVFGLGVTGQLHVQLAKAHGAYPVIGVNRSAEKRVVAEKIGADFTFAPGDGLKDEILEVTEGRGADLVIESVGHLGILAQAIDVARIGGRLLLFGIYTQKEGALPFYDLYFKELQVINARVAKAKDFPACIDFVKRGVVDLKPIITDVVPLTDFGKAMDMLNDSSDPGRLKIILDHAA